MPGAESTDIPVVWDFLLQVCRFSVLTLLLALSSSARPELLFAAQEARSNTADEDREAQRQRVAREMASNRQKIIKRFPGYGKHSRQFRAVCEIVKDDGRGAFLHEFGAAQNLKRPDCPGCKSFYKVLSKSCRPKSIKRTKSAANEAEKPPVKQRQPHTVAIQRASELGYTLAEDARYLEEHYQVLSDFHSLLKSSDVITPAARDYALLLLEAMTAHFVDYEKEIFKKAQKKKQQRQGLSFIERDKAEEYAELEELFHFEHEN